MSQSPKVVLFGAAGSGKDKEIVPRIQRLLPSWHVASASEPFRRLYEEEAGLAPFSLENDDLKHLHRHALSACALTRLREYPLWNLRVLEDGYAQCGHQNILEHSLKHIAGLRCRKEQGAYMVWVDCSRESRIRHLSLEKVLINDGDPVEAELFAFRKECEPDFILDNNGPVDALDPQIEELVRRMQSL